MRRFDVYVAFAVCLWSAVAAVANADEPWNRFRGPNGSGISEAATVPATWTEADYNWKIDLPGAGISAPVLWEAIKRDRSNCPNRGRPKGS